MPFLHLTPDMTLDRPTNPRFRPTLNITYRPGGWFGCRYPKTLKYGWKAEFVAHYGTEKTVVSYRKERRA
jgi:hypothetical protein